MGFRDEDSADVSRRARVNEVGLTRVHALVAARDSEGLRKHTEQAAPFQKALGLASIEHLLIQAGALKEAEQSVAVSAAAGAWARKAMLAVHTKPSISRCRKCRL